MLLITVVFIWGHLKAPKGCLVVLQVPFEKVMRVEGDTLSVNLLLVEMVHGFLGTSCHRLKTTALEHEVLGCVYSPVTSAYKLVFTPLFLSQLCIVFWP